MRININKKFKVTIMIFIIVLSIYGCAETTTTHDEVAADIHQNVESDIELTEAQYKMAGIKLAKVEYKNLNNSLQVNGMIDVPPQNLVNISVPIGGFIIKSDLLQGMHVKKGQLLAQLEHPDYIQLQQEYLDNKHKLIYMEQEYQRQSRLDQENVNSKKEFQKVTSEYFSLKAQVKGLSEKLDMLNINANSLTEDKITRAIAIYSPIDGYVSEVNVNQGKYVSPSDVLFEIVDTEHLHAELTVYEKDIVNVNQGQRVRFKLPNESNNERLASIYLIGRKIDQDRAVKVHAHLAQEDKTLLPGMYITAIIELSDDTVMAVPSDAVVSARGKNYLYYFKEKKEKEGNIMYSFKRVEINKGIVSDGYVQVLPIQKVAWDSMSIVVEGAYSLLSQMENTGEGGH